MNPPSHPIVDYSIEEWPKDIVYPPCKKCGKSHGIGIKDMSTGHIQPLDLCYDCLWSGLIYNPINEQITLKN